MNDREREICTQIYERDKERLNWYMWKNFSWLRPEDVHDIMQDVWRILSENIDTVATWSEAAQWVWLMRVCHNHTINFTKRNSRLVDWEDEFEVQLDETARVASVEDQVIEKVMVEALLSKLTKEDQKVLLKNLSPISAEKKKRESNADICKIYRTRKKLRKFMKEGGWDE